MLGKLSCLQTQCRILAERSFLKTLGGGCSAPVAVHTVLSKNETFGDSLSQVSNYELNIDGAVWSLDGQTEVLGAEKCSLNLNCTRKRVAEGNGKGSDSPLEKSPRLAIDETDRNRVELSPPKIISHSQPTVLNKTDASGGTGENVQLAELIHIHEDAFKKCPYSSVLSSAFSIRSPSRDTSGPAENSTEEESKRLPSQPLKCPLNFPIGQDVMGQCPYFDTSNEEGLSALTNTDNNGNGNQSENRNVDGKPAGCPYHSKIENTIKVCPFSKKTASDVQPETPNLEFKLSKCPYIGASSSGAQFAVTEISETPCNDAVSSSVRLFCGLYRHNCYPLDIFETCETIGQKLAAQLIESGALKVMEVAQNEIRKST